MSTLPEDDHLRYSTRPDVSCWERMDPTEYNALGLTRPELQSEGESTPPQAWTLDRETALAALHLAVEGRLSQDGAGDTYLVRATADTCSAAQGQLLVAKFIRRGICISSDFVAQTDIGGARSIVMPLHQEPLQPDGRLVIFPHYPLGSLREYMQRTRLTQGQIHCIVEQVANTLNYFAGIKQGRVLVHGDIKPENLLVSSIDPFIVALTDFDHSLWLTGEGTQQHSGMLTLSYAAPEALGGLFSTSSDMWSLGMLVFELPQRKHPFDGLSDQSIRALLTTNWEGSSTEVSNEQDDNWCALLYGLLDRNHVRRWRSPDIQRWLKGDPQQIAQGLALGSEQSANTPLEILSIRVFTARSLSRAMVADWDAGIEALRSENLANWLENILGNQALAARRRELLGDESLSDDDRLIRFAYFASPLLEPRWRNVRLSSPAIEDLAARSLEGDEACYEQLVALRETTIVESFASLGIPGPRHLLGAWAESWQRYEGGWQQLQEAGAPDARPDDSAAFPALVRLWLSVDQRQKLFDRIEERSGAVRYLLRRDWYFALGHDLRTLPVEHQWILDSLDQSSLAETLMYSQNHRDLVSMDFREPPTVTDEQLMRSVLYSETTERLTRSLVPQYQSREAIILQGAEHPDQRLSPDTSDSFSSRLTAPIGRRLRNSTQTVREWLQRRFRRGASTATPPEAISMSISAIRVNLTLPRQHSVTDVQDGVVDRSESMGQAVLIRWDLPAGTQPAIYIGHAGLFGRRVKRQRVVRLPFRLEGAPRANALERWMRRNEVTGLPHRGQIILALFQPTIVWLRFKLPGRRWSTCSQVLRLGAPTIPLLGADEQLREVGELLPAQPEMFETSDTSLAKVEELLPLQMKLIPLNAQLSTVSEAMADRQVASEIEPVYYQSRDPRMQLPVAAYARLWRRISAQRHYFQR